MFLAYTGALSTCNTDVDGACSLATLLTAEFAGIMDRCPWPGPSTWVVCLYTVAYLTGGGAVGDTPSRTSTIFATNVSAMYANFAIFLGPERTKSATASGRLCFLDPLPGLCPWTPLGDYRLPHPQTLPTPFLNSKYATVCLPTLHI